MKNPRRTAATSANAVLIVPGAPCMVRALDFTAPFAGGISHRFLSMSRAYAHANKSLPICLLLVLLCLMWTSSHAQDDEPTPSNLRFHWMKSSETDLTTAFFGDYTASPESSYGFTLDYGRRFSETMFTLPIEMTWNIGAQYINERGYQPDIWGATAFIKAHYTWRLPFTEKRVRFGLGEGLSYLTRIPLSEQRDFEKKDVDSEKLLNYVEWSIDVPLKQFQLMQPLFRGGIKEIYVGGLVWHRSSVFGLFAETKGGINYMGFGFEARY